ncbi:MAG TPA: LysR family transcriptional regulator [Azospirillum sp.]|nr:LysR family transcriptional regulator [Azospirillum sp.]
MSLQTEPVMPTLLEGEPPEVPVTETFHWDDVQYFLELARKGTLLKAARRLRVSHTTVLRRIAHLEQQIDQKLFERTARGFVLTEVGWQLLAQAESMERAADGISGLSAGGDRLSGTVRIAAVEGLAARVLAPAFLGFRREHPGIVIELVTAMQIANLTKREADISVTLTRPTGPRLVARRLARCDVHLYASQAYLDRYGAPESADDLNRHIFVDYIEDLIEITALRWFRDTVDQRRVVFRSASPLSQLSAVVAGMGIGMFPDYMAVGEPSLRRVLPEEMQSEREFWLAIHEDLRNTPRMAAVFGFLKRVFQADPAFRR